MRFHSEHSFRAGTEAVLGVLCDPGFALGLRLPDLGPPQLLDSTDDGVTAMIRLRYEFVGRLDPVAQRLVGSGGLAWIQESKVDRSTSSGTLGFEAERDPRRLHGSAGFTVDPDGSGSIRRLDGELVVSLPGLGRVAERRIVPGLLRRLDIEAESVDAGLP